MRQLLMGSVMALFLLVVAGWGQRVTADITPVPVPVDHYKCYKAKGKTFDPKPTPHVIDQFEVDDDTVSKPFLICNPASKDDSQVFFPETHQLCYKVKGENNVAPVTVRVRNQFGTQILKVKTKEKLLCVPSDKACLDAEGLPIECPNDGNFPPPP